MASYGRQADDDTLHKMAIRIQSRAIRRCGQLLKEYQAPGVRTDKPGDGDGPRSQRQAAEEAGMSERQEKTASRVASIPGAEFNAVVEADSPPSITKLADMGRTVVEAKHDFLTRPKPPGFKAATALQGTTERFAQFCGEHDAKVVAEGFLPHEIEPTCKHIEVINDWLDRFLGDLKGRRMSYHDNLDGRDPCGRRAPVVGAG